MGVLGGQVKLGEAGYNPDEIAGIVGGRRGGVGDLRKQRMADAADRQAQTDKVLALSKAANQQQQADAIGRLAGGARPTIIAQATPDTPERIWQAGDTSPEGMGTQVAADYAVAKQPEVKGLRELVNMRRGLPPEPVGTLPGEPSVADAAVAGPTTAPAGTGGAAGPTSAPSGVQGQDAAAPSATEQYQPGQLNPLPGATGVPGDNTGDFHGTTPATPPSDQYNTGYLQLLGRTASAASKSGQLDIGHKIADFEANRPLIPWNSGDPQKEAKAKAEYQSQKQALMDELASVFPNYEDRKAFLSSRAMGGAGEDSIGLPADYAGNEPIRGQVGSGRVRFEGQTPQLWKKPTQGDVDWAQAQADESKMANDAQYPATPAAVPGREPSFAQRKRDLALRQGEAAAALTEGKTKLNQVLMDERKQNGPPLTEVDSGQIAQAAPRINLTPAKPGGTETYSEHAQRIDLTRQRFENTLANITNPKARADVATSVTTSPLWKDYLGLAAEADLTPAQLEAKHENSPWGLSESAADLMPAAKAAKAFVASVNKALPKAPTTQPATPVPGPDTSARK